MSCPFPPIGSCPICRSGIHPHEDAIVSEGALCHRSCLNSLQESFEEIEYGTVDAYEDTRNNETDEED